MSSRRRVVFSIAGAVLLIGIVAVLFTLDDGDGFTLVDGKSPGSYLSVFFLVGMDAVVPIFPGETTLNAAATLASQDQLSLGLVILAGSLGAIIGDSALFWIARRSSSRIEPQLERARANEKVAMALSFLDRGAPVLLVIGRYVPGLRFVINSTMGLSDMPYRSFLPWSALGGAIWAAYTCLLAYWVGSALDDHPLASVIISAVITNVVIGAFFLHQRRERNLATRDESGG